MNETYLIVGLGNPGEEYAHTRHNAGFDAIDAIAADANASYWKEECGSLCAHVKIAGHDVILAKPQSFMNRSGGPVQKLVKKYGIPSDHLIVIHDELDLPPGSIRVKFGGGLAGHNGLRSINEKLSSPDWFRIRVGIGRPPGRMPVTDWVLTKPKGDAARDFEAGISMAAEAAVFMLDHSLAEAQNKFNRTVRS